MTSVLAQQLQALGVKGHALPRPKGRASLLFADQQAADIDLQTIHELASQGRKCSDSQQVANAFAGDPKCLHSV